MKMLNIKEANIYQRIIIVLVLTVAILSHCGESSEDTVAAMGFRGEHYLEVGNSAELKSLFDGDFTIEVWVRGDSSRAVAARSVLMFGNNDGGDEIAIYQGAWDSSMVSVWIDDKLYCMYSVNGLDWGKREKHYLCLSRASDFFSFYVDGRRLKSVALSNTDLDIGSGNLLIGADYDPPGVNSNVGNYWVGTVDEVRIWEKAIQSSDVSFHNKHPDKLTEHYSPNGLDPLIGLWRFNEERTGFVPDESGHSHDAVIRGNPESVYWSNN